MREGQVLKFTFNGGIRHFQYPRLKADDVYGKVDDTHISYESNRIATALDSRLVKSGTASAKGLQTGSVVYASDGSKSMSAIYYDVRGHVVENREITNFGTQRVTSCTYTYTGQPLKTTVTEGSVTLVTENTYDTGSGLLTATDVTVNGVKQRVSAVKYDMLGRVDSLSRGNAAKGGTVSYKYNLHGQTTEIKGPGFNQTLHYADGPGTKIYNGSVSVIPDISTNLSTQLYKFGGKELTTTHGLNETRGDACSVTLTPWRGNILFRRGSRLL